MNKGESVQVLDKGYVKFIDSMGTDETIVETARMSTGRGFYSWAPYERCKTCDCGWAIIPPGVLDGMPQGGYSLLPGFTPGPCCDNVKMITEKYPRGDHGFLEFMYRNRHMSPFEHVEIVIEVQAPIMVFREWHRHRTQCMAGSTKLFFDLPGGIERRGTQKITKTIKEVYEKFQPTKRAERPERQENAFFPKQRIQAMRLRCVNEETKEVTHTSIVDVWESGMKAVFDVFIDGLGTIRVSAKHPFFTPTGWKRLEELADFDHPILKGARAALRPSADVFIVKGEADEGLAFEVPANESEEEWRKVVGWEGWYEVSNMGRVRRIAGGQGVRTQGTCKKLTPGTGDYLFTNLNRPGEQKTVTVHTLVLEAFSGPCPHELECRHLDGNPMNNWHQNLKWGTTQENADDRIGHGRTPQLKTLPRKITSITYVGEEMTYDIEVAEPWHNFVAEGFVVHNSFNEFSARYSQMPNLHYVPELERFAPKKTGNKQENSSVVLEGHDAKGFAEKSQANVHDEQDDIYNQYELMLEGGVPKEVARINTPVSRYSKMRAKTDLRNWLSFADLRLRPNAQLEIRLFAQQVANIIKTVAPRTLELFEEHNLYGVHLSRTEIGILRELLIDTDGMGELRVRAESAGLAGSEMKEFLNKIANGGKEILA